jgi:hypothetical protein
MAAEELVAPVVEVGGTTALNPALSICSCNVATEICVQDGGAYVCKHDTTKATAVETAVAKEMAAVHDA